MARPVKWRRIEHTPAVPFFVPSEAEPEDVVFNSLKLEELEAIRLKDLEGLEQEECAVKMQVSRPTFQRILILAREKIADCLINGKAVRIEGGNFTRNVCYVRCNDCSHEWSESFENIQKIKSREFSCPECGSSNIDCVQNCEGRFCHRHCRRFRGENE